MIRSEFSKLQFRYLVALLLTLALSAVFPACSRADCDGVSGNAAGEFALKVVGSFLDRSIYPGAGEDVLCGNNPTPDFTEQAVGNTHDACSATADADACTKCFVGSCCAELVECGKNDACAAIVECEDDAACREANGPSTTFDAMIACAKDRCPTECPDAN